MNKHDEEKDFDNGSEEEAVTENSEETVAASVGNYLKTRREARGISLKTISKDTKISVSKLEFLEKDSFDNLPNKIYVEGYIKSYAKSLGIDSGECLKILHSSYQEKSSNRHFSLQEIPKEHREKQTQASYAKMWFAVVGLAFILLVVIIFNYKKSSPSYSQSQEIPPPVQLKSVDTEASFKMTPNKIIVKKSFFR